MNSGLSQLELLPWLIALAFVGMPHGAMDWLIIRKIDREEGRGSALSVLIRYSLMMIAGGLMLAFAPVITCFGFLMLTAIHWGAADMHAYQPLQSVRDKGSWWMLATARGGLIIATPFAFQPEAAWQPFAALASGGVIAEPTIISQAALSLLTAFALTLCHGWLSKRLESPAKFLAESAGVVALLAVLPPMFAIGCYFLLVHSTRHLARLHMRSDIIRTGQIREALPRLIAAHVASWPFLIPAIVVVLVWAAAIGFSARSIAVASIGFYIIATLPHHLLGIRVLNEATTEQRTITPSGLLAGSTT